MKDDPTDRRPEETCFFPVFDDVYDLQEAKVACMERGGVLAILKNPNKVFKQFIRKQDNFKTLAGMWIDATYLVGTLLAQLCIKVVKLSRLCLVCFG